MTAAVTTTEASPSPRTGTPLDVDALAPHLVRCTQWAALAAVPWIGRGDSTEADRACVAAMRAAFEDVPGQGLVAIGEGEKDQAPMLYAGERVGQGWGAAFEVAVDPLECTRACASDAQGALAVLAVAPAGALWQTPGWYMDKLVVGPAAADVIDITRPVTDNLRAVAQALDRPVEDLTAVVLDKPRHAGLIEQIHAAGARVSLIPGGDVAGALEAVLPDGHADMLVGVGGTPEGVLTACAVRVLGGGMQVALAPQSDEEAATVRDAGQEPGAPLGLEDLVTSPDCGFVATSVTAGGLLPAPERTATGWLTHSAVCTPRHLWQTIAEVHRDTQLPPNPEDEDA